MKEVTEQVVPLGNPTVGVQHSEGNSPQDQPPKTQGSSGIFPATSVIHLLRLFPGKGEPPTFSPFLC